MDQSPQVRLNSTAHYFLEGLNELGLDYLFCNYGTDHAPLIEEMARWRKSGRAFPKTVLCPHENVAVHMAAGYAMATGRGQGVLVHVDVGTGNSAVAMHNVFRGRTPVLLMAGRAPFTQRGELTGARDTYVHFVQELYDQAGIVRPYVKWEYSLPSGVVAKEALRRAHTMMESDPKGPVYLVLPRETLAETWPENAVRAFPPDRFGAAAAAGGDPQAIGELADRLIAAKNPLLVTAYAGRDARTPAHLDELARLAGIRVFEFNPLHLNIPADSPCHAGFVPGKHVAEADVGILLDVDVPWIPRDTPENPATFWAQIDVDVVKQGFPMWDFATNLRIQGASRRILEQLLEALKAKATPAFRAAAGKRVEALAAEHAARRSALAKLAADRGSPGKINPQYLCAEVGRAIGPDDVVVNEAIRNTLAVFNQIPRNVPGTIVGLAGGGLGFSGGTALGVKLARPDRTVVQLCGDGSFYFCNPVSVYAVAKQYKLPIFTVVLDNSGWSAVKEATLRVYPDGEAKAANQYEALLAPDMNFAKVAEAAGAYGERVEDPETVPAAIQRCLAAVRGGQAAVLHARVTPL
ncbi:MAG TPA: thiamine pyrophosphate-requiring protein [Burkholderiales bacterium]|nr:thiamine pyrophosphate-requiring protein [Burkholderiales bacterium]